MNEQNNERAIFFEITNLCNHKCIHCCKQWEDNSCIRTADIQMLDKILAIPKSHLTISGGEPSLVKDKVFYLLNKEIVPITINTNLTYWSKQDLDYFNNHQDKLDLNVSVVSLKRNIYKQITKADTFDIFFNNLQVIDKNNFISMIINDFSFDSIDFTAQVLILMGFHNILISPQVPVPNCKTGVMRVVDKVNSLHLKYNNYANITTQGFCYTPYCDHKCNAGIGRFVIDTKGDVFPCAPTHPTCKLGTIDTDINILKENGHKFYYGFPKSIRNKCKGFMNI